ncbi:MAG: hypothetical protein II942_01280 [Alphaproteobacteria bacterium]|nr:hypothetical protein [Alphaproteobacteria bacterium]
MTDEKELLCPINCPFLANRSFMPKTMPFYCEKYATFLGMDAGKKVMKCSACLGVRNDMVQTGLSLLEAQLLPQGLINQMKQAFLEMPIASQKTFVSILSQIGCQLFSETSEKMSPFTLMRLAQHAWLNARRSEESADAQAFLKLLDVAGGDAPLDGVTKSLLSNLFQVIDGSERSMLLTIMENPKNLESFLKSFSKTPHDKDLLKNFRALLYETHQQLTQQNVGVRLFQQQVRNDEMMRTIQQMTRARAAKAKSRF